MRVRHIPERLKQRFAGFVARAALEQAAILHQEHEAILFAIGEMHARLISQTVPRSLRDAEFRVFSQWGEDGIIQYLIRHVSIERKIFVEFGVGNYRESNTRFLMSHDDWEGLIIDSGTSHISFLERESEISTRWKYGIVPVSALLTTRNINEVIANAGIHGDIGLLSVDVDGNDYWLIEALTVVSSTILIVEYNSIFGPDAVVSVPYDPSFERSTAHYSGLYFGASLAALCQMADQKGYSFVGCNNAGVNAFFVRKDVVGDLPVLTAREGYVASRLSQSRDESGSLSYVRTHEEQLRLIADLPLWDFRQGRQVTIGDCYRLAPRN